MDLVYIVKDASGAIWGSVYTEASKAADFIVKYCYQDGRSQYGPFSIHVYRSVNDRT
jgi:hypothetical protein